MHFEQISLLAFQIYVFCGGVTIAIAVPVYIVLWVDDRQASPFLFAVMLTLAAFSLVPAYDRTTPGDMQVFYGIFCDASILYCLASFIRFVTWDPLARQRRRQLVRERAYAEALQNESGEPRKV